MNVQRKIQLKTTSILNVPLQTYSDDFLFIINGKEFKTSRLNSDLLSPRICKIHSNDPAFNQFIINTTNKGDFSILLKLLNFEQQTISESDIPFISEVIGQLNNDLISFDESNHIISKENVFSLIAQHQTNEIFFSKYLQEEINFISTYFHELVETNEASFSDIKIEILQKILNNSKLQLEDEDQLLSFINNLYMKSRNYSILYESVLFSNVSSPSMHKFTQLYDFNDITNITWRNLCLRLSSETVNICENDDEKSHRYKTQIKKFPHNASFSGIINYLTKNHQEDIESIINFTSSSILWNDLEYKPSNVALFDNFNSYFHSENEEGSWICLDFIDRRVAPIAYEIRSAPGNAYERHPKSWVIEGSSDNLNWSTLDTQNDCLHINGYNVSHTFPISNEGSKEFRYIRMRSTSPDWQDTYCLLINAFEIYGTLIE